MCCTACNVELCAKLCSGIKVTEQAVYQKQKKEKNTSLLFFCFFLLIYNYTIIPENLMFAFQLENNCITTFLSADIVPLFNFSLSLSNYVFHSLCIFI